MDRMLTFFGIERSREDPPPEEAWPLSLAPFIRLAEGEEGGVGERVMETGQFGLVPFFKKTELQFGRRTYNARSETVATLPSFRGDWGAGRRCIVPAEAIFEPNYESGKAVRWRISLPGDVPMGIAGVYSSWRDVEGKQHFSFAMLTVNADGHPVMGRMHAPSEEKRMVIILEPSDYGRWLSCSVADAPSYFRRWKGPIDAVSDPLPPRGKRTAPWPPESTGDLF
jgi:putative SOS response-associated peptidase YedK